MRLRRLPPWLASLALSGCMASQPPAAATQRAPVSHPPPDFIGPARLLPDIPDKARPVGLTPDGSRQFLLMNMRLTEHADGTLERAQGLLPSGPSKLLSAELPSRLGGGFLFASTSAAGTQVWRADSWLAPLRPIVRFSQAVTDLVPGFDRVFFRSTRTPTALFAIDPSDGTWLDAGSLPVPLRFGPAVFVDSWRAAVVCDLRGPLTTFDGGASWHPLPVSGEVARLETRGANLLVVGARGSLVVGPDGTVVEQGPVPTDAAKPSGPGELPAEVPDDEHEGVDQPLGRRPLRVAVELGYPYRDGKAVVADNGSIAEVSTIDGKIVRITRDAYPDSYTSCQAIRLGRGIGFVCGQPFGATSVFELLDGLTVREVLRWPEPRVVFPSPNGALVARAPCPGAEVRDEATRYCVRSPAGRIRELRIEGDVGAERVIPLADGRVAVVVAPRPGAEGRLVVLDGSQATTKALSFAAVPPRLASLVRRGLWLQGAQEIRPGVLGFWVESGGPVMGVQCDLEGRVRAGVAQPPSGEVIVSGRFGLVWKKSGESLETTDGGMTWTEFDMPSGWQDQQATRSCSPVGCVFGGFLRVGWGASPGQADLDAAPVSAKLSNPPYDPPRRVRLRCTPTGRSSPPPLSTVEASPSAPGRVRINPWSVPAVADADPRARGWLPFGSTAPPTLSAEETGVAAGRDYGDFRFRAYAWGPRSADWTRTGRFQVRVDDPYDPVSGPWVSAVSVSPWPDPTTAMLRIGNMTAAAPDPGGRAAVISWCPMPAQCQVLAVSPGAAPLPLVTKDSSGLPVLDSIVRTDESWYLLAKRAATSSVLWAADRSGNTSRIATFPRTGSAYTDDVALVRRAMSAGVGLWTVSSDAQGNSSWVVLPVDVTTGRLEAPVVVGRADFGGVVPPPCAPGQDGWLVDLPIPSALDLMNATGAHFGGSIKVRMRAGAGWACIESISARAQQAEVAAPAGASSVRSDERAIPLVVWDQPQNRRYELRCMAQP